MRKGIDTVLVVPTIRENSFHQFINRWHSIGLFDHVDLIVMEDNPEVTFHLPSYMDEVEVEHYCWKDIEKELGEHSWIVPRRSDTVRSFAYYMAWKKNYSFILTLDDDCYPCGPEDGLQYDGKGFVESHKKYLNNRSKWFNTLNSVKPRGIPFYNVGRRSAIVNHGLWTNVLDYDAPFQLANPIPEQFSYDNRVVPSGLYFPMCGMNVMWKNEATVLMYHLLMGQMLDGMEGSNYKLRKLAFDRFGDIWCGIFMKKIADYARLQVSSGMPYIRHERASNPFTNLKKEANGIEVNEKLWEYVDKLQFSGYQTIPAVYRELGFHISYYEEFPEHREYFVELGSAMIQWGLLLDRDIPPNAKARQEVWDRQHKELRQNRGPR